MGWNHQLDDDYDWIMIRITMMNMTTILWNIMFILSLKPSLGISGILPAPKQRPSPSKKPPCKMGPYDRYILYQMKCSLRTFANHIGLKPPTRRRIPMNQSVFRTCQGCVVATLTLVRQTPRESPMFSNGKSWVLPYTLKKWRKPFKIPLHPEIFRNRPLYPETALFDLAFFL